MDVQARVSVVCRVAFAAHGTRATAVYGRAGGRVARGGLEAIGNDAHHGEAGSMAPP